MVESSRVKNSTKNYGATEEQNVLEDDHDIPKVHSTVVGARRQILPCLPSYLIVTMFLSFLLYIIYFSHYSLPIPVNESYTLNNEPVFSEGNAREIVRVLSEDIGHRVVSTVKLEEATEYILEKITEYKQESLSNPYAPNFDIDVQSSTGSHKLGFMSKPVMKTYANITNIVVRLSCGPECNENSILLNSHYDSALASPAAADDAVGVAVMMEIIRILSQTKAPLKNSVIFLFNGAEETVLDASHAFISTHAYADSIRGFINLEACGQIGPEILFQASSLEMIRAYQRVPYPHGAAMANDIFNTGIILSDTDYRQFVEYGNLTGLDIALYKYSYFYHTEYDQLNSIPPGTLQHMGENVLALTKYLVTESTLSQFEYATDVIYFDVLGKFFVVYQFSTAKWIHTLTAIIAFYLVNKEVQSNVDVMLIGAGFLSIFGNLVFCTLLPITVSILLSRGIGQTMTWFTNEYYCLIIYGPASVAGFFLPQLLLRLLIPSSTLLAEGEYRLERILFHTALLFWGLITCLATYLHISSSYLCFIYTASFIAGLLFNDFVVKEKDIHLMTYLVASIFPTILFGNMIFSSLDIFVPLTGRMGVGTPVDLIIGILVGGSLVLLFPVLMVFGVRYGQKDIKRVLGFLALLNLAGVIFFGIYPGMDPYNVQHPQRTYIQQLTNLTANTSTLYIAHADPGVKPLETSVIPAVEQLLTTTATYQPASTDNRDFDSLYPYAQFLVAYKFPLPPSTSPFLNKQTNFHPELNTHLPLLTTLNSHFDPVKKTRNVTIFGYYPGLIWSVMTFEADVVAWSLDVEAEPGLERHVIKHVTGYAVDEWKVEIEYKAQDEGDKLNVVFSALEREVVGNKGWEKHECLQEVKGVLPDWVTTMWLSSVTGNYNV